MKTISRSLLISAVLLLLTTAGAHAHIIPGNVRGFGSGFAHPLHGLDHILAMVAVGFWAVQLGGRARWLVPASFVGVMALGGALAMGRASCAIHRRGYFAFGTRAGNPGCRGGAVPPGCQHGYRRAVGVFPWTFAWHGNARQRGWLRLRRGFRARDGRVAGVWHRDGLASAISKSAGGALGRRGDCRGRGLSLGVLARHGCKRRGRTPRSRPGHRRLPLNSETAGISMCPKAPEGDGYERQGL